VTYNTFVEHLIMPAGDLLLNTRFMAELRYWRKLMHNKPQEIQDIQEERLNRILHHATQNITFYSSTNAYQQGKGIERLGYFPIMYKQTIKDNIEQLVKGDPGKLVCEQSSGSSGIQGMVYMSRQEQYRAIAAQTFLWEWSGYRIGNPLLQLGMTLKRSTVKILKDKVLRTNYQQAFNINPSEAKQALQLFIGKNGYFGGYASGLYAYACLAEQMGIQVQFRGVISWGDKMFDHYRSKIEHVFNTRIYDTYGTTEGFIISGQCEHGNQHIMTPHVYLEILDQNGKEVEPGQLGYVVVTRLDAYAMPLIRYYLGDMAVKAPADERCLCGRPFPMLKKIIGRDTDIVRTPLGKYVIVHFFTGIFEHIPEIRQFRVVQQNLQGITIEYIPDQGFDKEILQNITQKIQDFIQEPFIINFKPVDYISSTPSGKPQIVKSLLEKPAL